MITKLSLLRLSTTIFLVVFVASCSYVSLTFSPDTEISRILEDLHTKFGISELDGPKDAVRLWQEFSLDQVSYTQIEESDGSIRVVMNEIPIQKGKLLETNDGNFRVKSVPIQLNEKTNSEVKEILKRIRLRGEAGFPLERYLPVPVPDDGWMIIEARTNGENWNSGYLYSSESKEAQIVKKLFRETYETVGIEFEM